MYKYSAFGLAISSELAISQIPCTDFERKADVRICRTDFFDMDVEKNTVSVEENVIRYTNSDSLSFEITNGNLVTVAAIKELSDSLLSVLIMGFCMGAILHQRGFMPLHGSCVTDGNNTILILGNSGAGKSTLAAEFLNHGWQMLTDDVAVVKSINSTPLIQSSYPSQKLWENSMSQYKQYDESVCCLYTLENANKYGRTVKNQFYEGTMPLTHIVRLLPSKEECSVKSLKGINIIDQLMCNTYCLYMVEKRNRQRHFQRCVTLAQKVPMSLVIRKLGEQNASLLYRMILDIVKKNDAESTGFRIQEY